MRFALAVLWLLGLISPASAADSRPNILFLFADDQNTNTIGCYPESWPWVKTPNIDAPREDAASASSTATSAPGACRRGPRCSPAAIRTPSSRCGWKATIPAAPTIRRSARSGRESSGNTATTPPRSASGTPAPTPATAATGTIRSSGTGPSIPRTPATTTTTRSSTGTATRRTVDGYSTDNYTEWACDYISGEGRDQRQAVVPLALLRRDPRPLDARPAAQGQVQGRARRAAGRHSSAAAREARVPQSHAGLASKEPTAESTPARAARPFGDEAAAAARPYADWVRQVNECARRSTKASAASWPPRRVGQLENTLVVYSADQGFAMGEHGFRAKLAPYDANYNSPLIVSIAGKLPAGKVCQLAGRRSPISCRRSSRTPASSCPGRCTAAISTAVLKNPDARRSPAGPVLRRHGRAVRLRHATSFRPTSTSTTATSPAGSPFATASTSTSARWSPARWKRSTTSRRIPRS